ADAPASWIIRRAGHIFRIALRRAVRDPTEDRALLLIGQTSLVEERAVRHVSMPRRHRSLIDLVPDILRSRTHLIVGQERHRADFAWPVTARAVLKKDRGDVLRVRRDGC